MEAWRDSRRMHSGLKLAHFTYLPSVRDRAGLSVGAVCRRVPRGYCTVTVTSSESEASCSSVSVRRNTNVSPDEASAGMMKLETRVAEPVRALTEASGLLMRQRYGSCPTSASIGAPSSTTCHRGSYCTCLAGYRSRMKAICRLRSADCFWDETRQRQTVTVGFESPMQESTSYLRWLPSVLM